MSSVQSPIPFQQECLSDYDYMAEEWEAKFSSTQDRNAAHKALNKTDRKLVQTNTQARVNRLASKKKFASDDE